MGFDLKNKISAKYLAKKLKAAVHYTGKLGFTEATSKALALDDNSRMLFVEDTDDKEVLYLVHKRDKDEDAFPIRKAGRYFYINTKPLFDKLGVNYEKKTIIFDMIPIENEELEVYKLKKREMPRKQKPE